MNTQERAWRRSARAILRHLLLGGLATAAVIGAHSARAQQFSSLFAFGDSYADTGNLFKFIGPSATYPTGRFSGGTNFNDDLSAFYGVKDNNFAIGGALTGVAPNGWQNIVQASVPAGSPTIPGFAYEWQTMFPATGQAIPANALVTLSIGGNDVRLYEGFGLPASSAPAYAAQSAANAMAGINALVGYGARNLVFLAGDASLLPDPTISAAARPAGSAYSASYNQDMQSSLAPVAANGVRVEYIDLTAILRNIQANPAAFGFTASGVANGTNVCPLACIGTSAQAVALQNQYLYYVDGIHLTSAGFAIVAEYIENRLNAPETFAATGELGLSAVGGFVGAMFGRLDLFNGPAAPSSGGFMAYAGQPVVKGPLAAPQEPLPLSFFMQANGGIGTRSGAGNSSSYRWDGLGGDLGVEYRVTPNFLVGAAYSYSAPQITLGQGAGTQSAVVNQFGLYGAYDAQHLFAQGVLSYGASNYSLSRPGVLGALTASPSGTTFAAAFKTGYLFDVAPATRIGPILGLTYVRAHVNGYSETGDTALDLNLNGQNAEAVLGAAGAQLRYVYGSAYGPIDTFVNVTAENNFEGSSRVIQYSAVSAPLIVNSWSAASAPNHAFVRFAAGASMNLTTGLALTGNFSQTVGQPGGDDFTGSGGLKIAF
jgi:phospholipase/lecithinase/hemolysin/uncharacterized protein YhjY with autotransporter beta-barrel domain